MLKEKILLIACLVISNVGISQITQKNKYVIVTYEHKYSKSLHGIQRYFWVISSDSIKSFNSTMYPLFLSDYSKSQLADCISGKSIDPAIPTFKHGDQDFDSIWLDSHNKLDKLIHRKRKLLQTIKKTWSDGNNETISIYATPIFGELYSCELLLTGQPPYPYRGKIFLVGNFVKSDTEFWNSGLANFILKQDYSNLNFRRSSF